LAVDPWLEVKAIEGKRLPEEKKEGAAEEDDIAANDALSRFLPLLKGGFRQSDIISLFRRVRRS